jgi:hypothetical protein
LDKDLASNCSKVRKIRRDCVSVFVDDSYDEGHQRFDIAQIHLIFQFKVEGKRNSSMSFFHVFCADSTLNITTAKVHRLALVRYFTKKDNEQHVTGMTRIYADSQKKAELVDVQSIVRYVFLINREHG